MPDIYEPTTGWDLSCPDWEQRLKTGKSLIPTLPLDLVKAERAVNAFNLLRLADVPGTPYLAEACGDWFREIVRALFGSQDKVTRQRMIRELFLLVPKKNAKAIALDTSIATPSGFTSMGEIRVGDFVIDSDGKPTRVLVKSEVFHGRECYEVEFSTGEKVVCDAEHLWVTDAYTDRDKQARHLRRAPCPSAKTTKDIGNTLRWGAAANNHRVALCGALELPTADLLIDPYVLGLWLGDGCSTSPSITAGWAYAEEELELIRSCGVEARLQPSSYSRGSATITLSPCDSRTDMLARLGKLGLVNNKHIPAIYLRAAKEQRLELLRGLMDSDGCIAKGSQASFTTILPALRDGIIELIASVGLKPNCDLAGFVPVLNGKACSRAWAVRFTPHDREQVFKLKHKLERQKASDAKNGARSLYRQIVAVRPVPSVPTQCIAVESETHQYLVTRSLIPTHNTSYGALMMLIALLLNERPRASLIMTAPVQDVTQLAFDQAAGAIALDPMLEKLLYVREHVKTIVHRVTKAELQIMTFDPATLTGQKPVAALIDELHVVAHMSKSASAIRQIRGGMLPFPEAFMAFITTQSEDAPSGVFAAELKAARDVRDGKLRSAVLPVLYEFPEAMQQDEAQWRDPANWWMVTPNRDRSITIPRLQEDMATAESKGKDELIAWASQHLNLQIGVGLKNDSWAGAEFWTQQTAGPLTLDQLLKMSEVVVCGIDGGGLDDMLSLAVLGRKRGSQEVLHWGHSWLHPIALERRKQNAAKYRDFEKDGDLTIVDSIGDDVGQLADIIQKVNESGLLDKIGLDPSGIGEVLDEIESRGVDKDMLQGIPQGWRMMTAIKTAERWLAEGQLWHGGTRLMAWSVGNAKIEPRGNAVLLTKQTNGSAKIDPVLAMLDAVALMALNPASREREYVTFL